MGKLLESIKKKLNNEGSGIVLVIVALGFIGILTGALLTAVGYAYRLKLTDYNARNNFYYVEEAMDEIYAGVGNQTMKAMHSAYEDVISSIIQYDVTKNRYNNIGNDTANEQFQNKFIENVKDDPFFASANLANNISKFISNNTVSLVNTDKLRVDYEYEADEDGNPTTKIKSIIIRNICVSRTAGYKHTYTHGDYVQTISADIDISRPDFKIHFNNISTDISDLFSFAMIADSGVEFNNPIGSTLAVSGNIYAAADFYNKDYNINSQDIPRADRLDNAYINYDKDGNNLLNLKYKVNPVSSYLYKDDSNNTAFNHNDVAFNGETNVTAVYDGDNLKSRYSGLYVNGSNVILLSRKIIVPGTISIMDGATLKVYGSNGQTITNASVWADNVILGNRFVGSSQVSEGIFNANMYIKDDTQIDAANSKFKLIGSYFGYSNSSTSDGRSFIPNVKSITATQSDGTQTTINIYQKLNSRNEAEARGHYNSSAIVVNGENSTVDLTLATNLYIAGRAYIELSRETVSKTDATVQVRSGSNVSTEQVVTEEYNYYGDSDDYKTGESLSLLHNQIAYKPASSNVLEETDTDNETHNYVTVSTETAGHALFKKYFGTSATNTKVPVAVYTKTVNGNNKRYIYFDFDYAARKNLYDANGLFKKTSTGDDLTGDDLSASFLQDYYDYLTYFDDYFRNGVPALAGADHTVDQSILVGDIKSNLENLISYDGFKAGQVAVNSAQTIYASGAVAKSGNTIITTTNDDKVNFNVMTSNEVVRDQLSNVSDSTMSAAAALDMSNNFQKHYNYLKFTLNDVVDGSAEANFVDTFLANDDYSEGSITPINYYLNMDVLNQGFDENSNSPINLKPVTEEMKENTAIPLGSSYLDLETYKVWISTGDVTIECENDDNHILTGIVVAQGDVYFNNYTGANAYKNVNEFNGIIISGGKIYINGAVTKITATDLCKNIIDACVKAVADKNNTEKLTDEDGNPIVTYTDAQQRTIDNGLNAMAVLKLFKAYEDAADNIDTRKLDMTITNIDYSDVIRYDNWMKNVEE